MRNRRVIPRPPSLCCGGPDPCCARSPPPNPATRDRLLLPGQRVAGAPRQSKACSHPPRCAALGAAYTKSGTNFSMDPTPRWWSAGRSTQKSGLPPFDGGVLGSTGTPGQAGSELAPNRCTPALSVRVQLKQFHPALATGARCTHTTETRRHRRHTHTHKPLTTSFSDGSLGSHNDEERREMRYVMRIAGSSESSNL